ncbi:MULTISPECIES: TetR/AcrR family transcriptional regulator [Metabacillus]|jgi:AcrR family transcriptional regulator|uniref:TetR/AcrR family transcriptional regulator n=1 Tax=Metabacillus hrfriensis TaxID=3048891 RepID=A0ACD4RDS1_9BACI|nr:MULTISPECIES: TetR/AcrR family transcriptional regulator [Metabacillus]UAL53098.1 TetR/AcrR family transcriptional regulator [Metabacillus dongyingensis]UOK58659.1 TetR/AcrR family transcriptional regulator [Bacillus sp. OVS6]USK29422.1 TetR/AcrR family transcriptional regulator [Bacillus sp. CMF21]WHZ58646.1 TetR/AcrR family transcriptional regulator [Metabacillus sp. CT-WN-B3]
MTKVDRRILKSQEAIKNAFIELMSEKDFDKITVKDICDGANVGNRTFYLHYLDKFDLLDKLIEEYINELKILCASVSELSFKKATLIWFEFLENHYLFFSTMLTGKGAFAFHKHFLEFIIEELKNDVDIIDGKNKGFSETMILTFFGSAIVGVVETYFMKGIPDPPEVVAEQLGMLLDRNL